MNFPCLKQKLKIWYELQSARLSFPNNATQKFLLAKLRSLFESDILEEKQKKELGTSSYLPLGRWIVVLSEKDILGNLYAILALHLTGNTARIKVRESYDTLQAFLTLLEIPKEEMYLENWNSRQGLPADLFQGIQGVLLAGSEDLIQTFRKKTPAGIRLVEFGPKISVAAIGSSGVALDAEALLEMLIEEVTLFHQEVCSSPQFIVVEDPTLALYFTDQLTQRLKYLSLLPHSLRLEQYSRYHFLKNKALLETKKIQVLWSPETGWGAVSSPVVLAPEWCFLRGFHFVVGDLKTHLKTLASFYENHLQTLGYAGFEPRLLSQDFGFTRLCPLGKMHHRSFLESHDGLWELPQFVKYICYE
jgi:hypothetical protein